MAFTRFMIVVAFLVLWIGGIGVRLVHLQVAQHDWLRGKALDMRQDVKQTKMLRGSIFDRNGRTLAMSLRVRTLYADPAEINDTDATAKTLASVLKLDAGEIAAQLRAGKVEKKRFIPIAKKLDDETVQRINKALDTPEVNKADLPNYSGLHWRDGQKRSYPNQSLAAQVIGFSNGDDDGRAGIEQSQDDVLHGAVIKKLQERDRLGRVYEEKIVERDLPGDVFLTLDADLQFLVEQALERGVRAAQARSGFVVVMRPKTGEILALANYPTFDPNTITDAVSENLSNKAIQFIYSPGSVFKLVTYGAGLEKRLFTPTDEIDSGNGTITIADHKFTDSHTIGRVSYSQAMAHSSNVCAIKTGMRVGREDFFGLVQKMCFGAKTGVELPAETQGIVRPIARWNGDSLASMSIGYEIGVTALQMTSAFATIANNGIRIQPHIIKEIRRSGDQPKIVTQPNETQVVSPETAQYLRTMFKQVVLTGTGRRAKLNGYTAAGKTGTAWKFNANTKSIDRSKYISSFIGMAPADDPELVIGIVMDEPKSGARDGGTVSAPVFQEIAQILLQQLKVMPDAPIRQESLVAEAIPESPVGGAVDENPADNRSGAETKPGAKERPSVKDKVKEKPDAKNVTGQPKLTAWRPRKYDGAELFRKIERVKIET
ncbi:MAG: penicillin-binding protein 2 [Pyrinomonadaceae bacterium]